MQEAPALEQEPEVKSEDVFRFDKSLEELKDLRSQLHYAADYCETSFLSSTEKRAVIENTKEYICKTIVTLVDHLGNVSANLNDCITKTNEFSDAEIRIQCFKQRLLSCELYAHKLALTRMRWRENIPKHHRRYLSMPIMNVLGRPSEDLRDYDSPNRIKLSKGRHELDTEEMPLFMYTRIDKPTIKNPPLDNTFGKVMPVRNDVSLSNGMIPKFQFQSPLPKLGRSRSFNRRAEAPSIFSLIRRVKRSTTKD